MYTDEQLRKVAERIGLTIVTVGAGDCYVGVGGFKCMVTGITRYLLSPEGRCAIEDKFADSSDPLILTKQEYGYSTATVDEGGVGWHIGRGTTPAEAWLDAAVKYTEGL